MADIDNDLVAVLAAATVAQVRALPPQERHTDAAQATMQRAAEELAAATGTSVVEAAGRIHRALR